MKLDFGGDVARAPSTGLFFGCFEEIPAADGHWRYGSFGTSDGATAAVTRFADRASSVKNKDDAFALGEAVGEERETVNSDAVAGGTRPNSAGRDVGGEAGQAKGGSVRMRCFFTGMPGGLVVVVCHRPGAATFGR